MRNWNRMKNILKDNKICAIMRGVPTESAVSYAKAVYNGGIRMFEVAMNTSEGARQIEMLRSEFGDSAYVGAGTVINEERCRDARKAGAQFFLTPNVAEVTLKFCREYEIPLLPGVLTPTDVGICLDYGYNIMKLFPAGDMPMSYIRSLQGPFDGTQYVAVGGVSPENIGDFFKAGFIGVGIGSNLIPKEMVKRGAWDEASERVAGLCKQAEGLGNA